MQWTLELLKRKAEQDPGFSFYSELHPSRRVLLAGELIEFVAGYAYTTNATAAYYLLSMDGVQPGEWAKEVEKYAQKKRKGKR